MEETKAGTILRNSGSRNRAIIFFLYGFILAISISTLLLYLTAHDARDSTACVAQIENNQTPSSGALVQSLVPGANLPAVAAEGSADHHLSNSKGPRSWSGVVYPTPPSSGTRFAATKASITLPRELSNFVSGTKIKGNEQTHRIITSAWVGIDATAAFANDGLSADTTAFLQAGVDFQLLDAATGELGFRSWYRWWPLDGRRRRDLGVRMEPGDQVAIEVVAFNATSAKVVVRNNSRRQVTQLFLDAEAELKGGSAEWIVGAVNPGGSLSHEWDNGGGLEELVMDFDFVKLHVELADAVAYTNMEGMVVAGDGEVRQNGKINALVHANGSTVRVDFTH